MRRPVLPLLTVMIGAAAPAYAHPGHLADVAGHDHWVAGVAIGLAVLAGLWGAVGGKRAATAHDGSQVENSDEPGEGETAA